MPLLLPLLLLRCLPQMCPLVLKKQEDPASRRRGCENSSSCHYQSHGHTGSGVVLLLLQPERRNRAPLYVDFVADCPFVYWWNSSATLTKSSRWLDQNTLRLSYLGYLCGQFHPYGSDTSLDLQNILPVAQRQVSRKVHPETATGALAPVHLPDYFFHNSGTVSGNNSERKSGQWGHFADQA